MTATVVIVGYRAYAELEQWSRVDRVTSVTRAVGRALRGGAGRHTLRGLPAHRCNHRDLAAAVSQDNHDVSTRSSADDRGLLAALALAAGAAKVAGQEPRAAPPAIQSLTEPGQGLDVRARSADGRVTFASRAGGGVLLRGMQAARADERALAFVEAYGEPFGLRARSEAR